MTTLRATILIAVLSLSSKLLGAVRQAVFAHTFGAGQEMDIYVAAFRVPDLLFNLLILGTLSVAFIPIFVEYLHRDKKQAFAVASTIFNLTLLGMGIVGVVGFFLSPTLVNITVPGFTAAAKAEALKLSQILMLSPLLFSLSSLAGSILHAHKRFLLAGIAPLLYNFSIIAGVLFFYPLIGLPGIAWGVVLGAFLHLGAQLPAVVRLGLRPWQKLQLLNPGVKKIGRLFWPRILGMDLGQISLYVASIIASFQASGSLAAYYFAYDLETVPLGIFAVSFAIAAFPMMAEYFSRKNFLGLRNFFSRTAVQILFLMIPISVLVILLRAQIVRLILGAGEDTAFSFSDTRQTAQTLGVFAFSLFAQSLVPLLARGFYAMQNTVIPVISGLVSAGVNIGLAFIFHQLWPRPASLALAFSVATFIHLLIMLLFFRQRLQGLDDEFLILRFLKISIASVAMGVVTYATLYAVAPLVNMQTYLGVLLQTLAALVMAILSYLLAGLAIKLPESSGVLVIFRTWFLRFTKPLTAAIVDLFTDLR